MYASASDDLETGCDGTSKWVKLSVIIVSTSDSDETL